MAAGDEKTFTVKTSKGFVETFRELDEKYEGLKARRDAAIRQGDYEIAEGAAIELTATGSKIQDLIFDELECHWGPKLLESRAIPELPDDWRTCVRGRFLEIKYEERDVYEGS
ncbi:hypothetical protein OAU50_06000 [Planctomycetota bacterium]|nr:hypothetical protein [Planctomycetota bacterium]